MNTATGTTQVARRTQPFTALQFGTPQLPLAREQVTGCFSLLEDHAMTLAAVPGMVLCVRRGTLRVGREGERRGHWLLAGARFVAERDQLVALSSPEAVELSVDWPQIPGTELAPRAS